MTVTFVDTAQEADVILDQTKLETIVDGIRARFSIGAFTALYIREPDHKVEQHKVFYPPFVNVDKVHTTYVYDGDTTGLIISIQ